MGVEEVMTVDPKHHKYFVARRGEVIRRIGDEFGGVVVSFPRQGVATDKVTLKGAKDCVEAARNKILETVEDLESQVMIECHIEQAHHRTIMGQKGSNVQGITSKYNVQIKFPEKNSNPQKMPNGDLPNGEAPPTNGNGNGHQENDIIKISGKKENCDAAANALKALVPINIEVEVPYKFHRFIIGQKGVGVRKLMEENDVNIKVPSEEDKSSTIVVTGAPANVERAKSALNEKVEELEKEEADKALKGFEIKIEVKPEYHPKLIGRGGQVIEQLRSDYDVNIQLPTKGNDNDESTIIITGYEKNANQAKDAIMKIINDFESLIKDEVSIDPRVHRMIVGKRGAGIRRIMSDYKVDIKTPREGAPDSDKVVTMGHDQDSVLDCRDHLLNIAEEYEQEVMDKEALDAYLKPASRANEAQEKKSNKGKGFEVTKAPWHGPTDDAFPTFGGGPGGAVAAPPVTWGPKR